MKLSPLQLAYYRVTQCSVSSRPEYDPEQDESDTILDQIHASLDVERLEEADTEHTLGWFVGLCLEFSPAAEQNVPYDFRIDLYGNFHCTKELPAGMDAEQLVGINGSSILYGIARELVQSITEKGMWGGLTLPSMSFTDYKDMLRESDDSHP
jgi:preprotein translocase subunit SecB